MFKSPQFSFKRANRISNGIFLVSLALLFLTNLWWPGILLAIWATLFSKQYLSGRLYDAGISSVVFLGLFLLTLFEFHYLAPVLLLVGGIFLIFREFSSPEDTNGEEKSVEIIEESDVQD